MSAPRGKPSFAPPAGLSASRFELAGDAFVVLEWPLQSRAAAGSLTPVERDVMALMLEGLSNAEIARRRGRSPRTIANQVGSLFRRLGVRSRFELLAWARGGARADEE